MGLVRETKLRYVSCGFFSKGDAIWDIPKLHEIGLCEDGLCGPAGKLAAVVLHFGGNDRTTLGSQLGPPVESAAGTLGLVVELVESLDDEELVLAADAVLHHSVQLGTHDKVN